MIDRVKDDVTPVSSFVNREKLIADQKKDDTLNNFQNGAVDFNLIDASNLSKSDELFALKNDLLLCLSSADNKLMEKIVAPTSIRPRLLKVAHDIELSGHSGITRTFSRISRGFWWPKM
jgi:hypothetical protein